jgi:hypothetical protein
MTFFENGASFDGGFLMKEASYMLASFIKKPPFSDNQKIFLFSEQPNPSTWLLKTHVISLVASLVLNIFHVT